MADRDACDHRPGRATRPSAAELARTLAGGHGIATVRTPDADREWPVLHVEGPLGLTAIVDRAALPGLGLRLGAAQDAVVLLSISASAPLPDHTLPRAVAVARGWARAVREVAPDDALAAAGTGRDREPMVLLHLDLVDWHVHEHTGCTHVERAEYDRAEPDPVAADEGDLLERLRTEQAGRLLALVRRMGHPEGRVRPRLDMVAGARPVGLDRYGLTLLCTWPEDDPETAAGSSPGLLRMPFSGRCDTAAQAYQAVLAVLPAAAGRPEPDPAAAVRG